AVRGPGDPPVGHLLGHLALPVARRPEDLRRPVGGGVVRAVDALDALRPGRELVELGPLVVGHPAGDAHVDVLGDGHRALAAAGASLAALAAAHQAAEPLLEPSDGLVLELAGAQLEQRAGRVGAAGELADQPGGVLGQFGRGVADLLAEPVDGVLGAGLQVVLEGLGESAAARALGRGVSHRHLPPGGGYRARRRAQGSARWPSARSSWPYGWPNRSPRRPTTGCSWRRACAVPDASPRAPPPAPPRAPARPRPPAPRSLPPPRAPPAPRAPRCPRVRV